MNYEYTPKYAQQVHDAGYRSAEILVPIIIGNYAHIFSKQPTSALDVGCCVGHFSRAFADNAVKENTGLDMPYIEPVEPRMEFIPTDLNKPFDLGKKFDIVTCLEVAEHLKPESAEGLIKSITTHTDFVVFSAAVPGQRGEGHINEQWASYWVDLFKENGFDCLDTIRGLIWNNPEVAVWYKNNILAFCKPTGNKRVYDALLQRYKHHDAIHPQLYAINSGVPYP
jgi:hypothetical protein